MIAAGIAAIVWGLTDRTPNVDSIILTSSRIVHAVVSSVGLVAALFGLVLMMIGSNGDHPIHARRGALLFLVLSLAVYLVVQGPELAAQTFARESRWADSAHNVINLTLLGLLGVWTVRDGLRKR